MTPRFSMLMMSVALLASTPALATSDGRPPVPPAAQGAEGAATQPHGGEGPRGPRPPMLDTDGDGKVTKAEFVTGMEKHFDQMDANKDGVLTEEERPKWKHRGEKHRKGAQPPAAE